MVRRSRSDRGVALLLAVSLVMLLVVLVGSMVISASHSRQVSDNYLADLQNTYALRSGYHHALLYLQVDQQESGSVDTLHERWSKDISLKVGRTDVTVKIEDAERYFNLAALVDSSRRPCKETQEAARRLLRLLNHDPSIVDRITDYVDRDAAGQFETGARNELLYAIDELMRIEGIDRKVVYGGAGVDEIQRPLHGHVTVWPREPSPCSAGAAGNLKVNLNTAPLPVLQALSDKVPEQAIHEIVAWRAGTDDQGNPNAFSSGADIAGKITSITAEEANELKKHVVFKSSTFIIRVRAAVDTLKKEWVYVVKRGAGTEGIKLLAQHRYQELKAFPDPGESP